MIQGRPTADSNIDQYQNKPRVRDSQSLLPRPHHNIAGLTQSKFGAGPQSEYKAMSGYQTDFVGQATGKAR